MLTSIRWDGPLSAQLRLFPACSEESSDLFPSVRRIMTCIKVDLIGD